MWSQTFVLGLTLGLPLFSGLLLFNGLLVRNMLRDQSVQGFNTRKIVLWFYTFICYTDQPVKNLAGISPCHLSLHANCMLLPPRLVHQQITFHSVQVPIHPLLKPHFYKPKLCKRCSQSNWNVSFSCCITMIMGSARLFFFPSLAQSFGQRSGQGGACFHGSSHSYWHCWVWLSLFITHCCPVIEGLP